MKLHSLVLQCQDYMSVNFHDFWRCFAILTKGVKLSSETPSAVRAIFERWYLTICLEILYETSQSCSTMSILHVGQFSWFLKMFSYVNQRCKVGLRGTPSAVRAFFERWYLTIYLEILYETSQYCSTMSRLHVSQISWFLKMVCYDNQRCKVGIGSTPLAIRAVYEISSLKNCPNC